MRVGLKFVAAALVAAVLTGGGVSRAQTPPAAPEVQTPPAAPAEQPAVPTPAEQNGPAQPEPRIVRPADSVEIVRYGRPAVRIGQDFTLGEGETVRDATVIFGTARISGEVTGDMVVVLGEVRLTNTAVLDRDLVVVGGSLIVEPGAVVRRDLVVVGSGFDVPDGFTSGREQVVIGPPLVGERIRRLLPWLTAGLLWGRLIVPTFALSWVVVAIFFGLYFILNLLFESPVRACTTILRDRPLSSFLVGLLVLLLVGPVSVILVASVIGIAVLPFLLCALLLCALFGKLATMRWIGSSLVGDGDPDGRRQATRAFAVGFAILTLMYMVPVLGIVVWASLSVFGLGGATMAFLLGLRREQPKPARPMPPVPPVPPTAPVPPQDGYAVPAASPFVSEGTPRDDGRTQALGADEPWAAEPPSAAPYGTTPPLAVPPPPAATAGVGVPPPAAAPPPPPPPPAGSLLAMPHASFGDRAAAFGLDVVLILFARGLIDVPWWNGPNSLFLLLLVYHVAFWTYKGTTVGGIICNLRLVRTDGAPLTFPDALVRGLASIFSLVVLGLGVFWILRDPDRQAWHDRIAGTYVIKVPRNYPV